MSSSDDSGQQATIQDLFRLVSTMRAENGQFRDEIKAEIIELRGELRAAKKDLGQENDARSAQMTLDKASIDSQLGNIRNELHGLRQELQGLKQDQNSLRDEVGRQHLQTKSMLDGHNARFRALGEKMDGLADQSRTILSRLDRAHIPAE